MHLSVFHCANYHINLSVEKKTKQNERKNWTTENILSIFEPFNLFTNQLNYDNKKREEINNAVQL